VKFGVVIGSSDAETAWNAFRFGIQAIESGHAVRVFLLGAGVECQDVRQDPYDVPERMQAFVDRGGELVACGTCLRARRMEGRDLCPVSTMQDLVDLATWADRVLTF